MGTPHIQDYQGKRIHMIGIGGSSMSGLAQMLKEKGYQVSGSDNLETYTTQMLESLGIPVAIGHQAENVRNADFVVYTVAILPDNPERVEMERLGLPHVERAQLLGQLMEGFEQAIGVCGAHGKTSTTSMISQVLLETEKDPSIHIGGTVDFIGGSTRIGRSGIFLAEACEFNASFLHMRPTLAVVLNIDADHLDFYRDIDHIQETFGQFLALLPEDGMVIGNGDDLRVRQLLQDAPCKERITFGLGQDNDWRPLRLEYTPEGKARFEAAFRGQVVGQVQLRVAGAFHVLNGLAALACAQALGADMDKACRALSAFEGAHRRFEHTSTIDGVKLYHDYGHNPAEMQTILEVAALQPHNRLWAVMQPHTFSRVKRLFPDYLSCTQAADITLVTDIYAAREKDPGDIKAEDIVAGMRERGLEAIHTPTFDDTEAYLRQHWRPGDLVLTLGCGNINQLNDQMWEHQQAREKGEE